MPLEQVLVMCEYEDPPSFTQIGLDPSDISTVRAHSSKNKFRTYPIESPCVQVKMKCGDTLICIGTPESFIGMTHEKVSQQRMP